MSEKLWSGLAITRADICPGDIPHKMVHDHVAIGFRQSCTTRCPPRIDRPSMASASEPHGR